MDVKIDGSRQRYVEVEFPGGEHARLTFIPAAKAGYGVDSVRVQIREGEGHLRRGPELPIARTGAVLDGLLLLARAVGTTTG